MGAYHSGSRHERSTRGEPECGRPICNSSVYPSPPHPEEPSSGARYVLSTPRAAVPWRSGGCGAIYCTMKPHPAEVVDERPPPPALTSARLLARLLDDAIAIPGTSFRIGIDPLLGMLPGLGDALAAALAGWLLVLAARMGAPAVVLVRMGLHVAADFAIGLVPGAGDLLDFFWKSNRRNLQLLEDWHARPDAVARESAARVVPLLGLVLLVAAAVVYALWRLVSWAITAR